ncbi:LPS assembly lipoprotein LptE [Agarilytica rhodophyticola]|uniref:LPS-assembly lipoprotein LptE n=1 Tax=Agarilytica rhodophyticola TaxID=1737490 RepID=UPI000B342CF9|nr:LPS assembly lipoprotein LptE [Agarilytica rhodophyticola]
MSIWISRFFVVASALVISSCGWQLRGLQQYLEQGPQNIGQIQLVTSADNRLFNATLKQQLKDLSIDIESDSDITLKLQQEKVERSPLSYSSTGIPVQYQLIMSIRFGVTNPLRNVPRERTLSARREYDFDTSLVVAKNEEEIKLLQEMREELSSRIISYLGK